jgi:hypothetical protein
VSGGFASREASIVRAASGRYDRRCKPNNRSRPGKRGSLPKLRQKEACVPFPVCNSGFKASSVGGVADKYGMDRR